ncbi:MAG: DJ-1/PfpI family protein [Proteobacteria bacterium]|nr:DJ-1/PfpI family protein [Pseudomonadota bacterium]
MSSRILIPIAPGCEELEAVTMINLFRRAGFTVITATLADQVGPVTCARGTLIIPETTLDQVMANEFDLLALPGGQPGTNNLMADDRVLSLVRSMAGKGRHIAAICAAPMVLGKAGILEGKSATSYPGSLEKMALKNVRIKDAPVVIDGRIITSRGPGTAMDFALEIIEILADTATRKSVEAGLQRPCS